MTLSVRVIHVTFIKNSAKLVKKIQFLVVLNFTLSRTFCFRECLVFLNLFLFIQFLVNAFLNLLSSWISFFREFLVFTKLFSFLNFSFFDVLVFNWIVCRLKWNFKHNEADALQRDQLPWKQQVQTPSAKHTSDATPTMETLSRTFMNLLHDNGSET